MIRLVNTILSYHEITNLEIEHIKKIISKYFSNRIDIYKYKYNDRRYYEVDFELLNFEFSKEKIFDEVNYLIKLYEEIMKYFNIKIDIIVANDDTEAEIIKYENDCNDIESFGLFITSRDIPNIKPYYSSDICYVYLNFKYVSFGVIF